jgi:hypothetical protein
MTDDSATPASRPEPRTVLVVSVGARVCVLIGLLFVVLAGYLYLGPIGHVVSGGFPARCGSAAAPPTDSLGKAVCGTSNDERRSQALAALVAAGVLAVGGFAAFGFTRVPSKQPRSSH